jgi:hypothetical protein
MDSGSLKHNLATNQPVLVTPNGLQLSVEMLQDMYSQNILAASGCWVYDVPTGNCPSPVHVIWL